MRPLYKQQLPLSIKRMGSNLIVQYATYTTMVPVFESGADLSSPTTLRFHLRTTNSTGGHVVDVSDVRIYPN